MKKRFYHGYECSHMRPVVKIVGEWHHINSIGEVVGRCEASVYKTVSVYIGGHYVSDLVS
jgi:hypothetical protein